KRKLSPQLLYWFWPSVLEDIRIIREAIDQSELDFRERQVALVALSRSVRQVSKADRKVVPPTISKRRRASFRGRPSSAWTAFRSNVGWIAEVLSQQALLDLPDSPAHVCRGNAMRLPVRSGTIDLSLFSPPYGNAHDYLRSTRL